MQIQPYLMLDGKCEEALEFYQKALGAKIIMKMRFRDAPDPAVARSGDPDKIMHARFDVGGSVVLASDGRCLGQREFKGFALSLTVASAAEAERAFAALKDGGTEQMPLAKTFFSPAFGMVADRFGVSWMVYVAP